MFNNRKDAGEKLGVELERYKGHHALVIGIPRGGVETAYYVARQLKAELSVVVSRKLGYPGNPEAAFGAVAEDGSLYLCETAREELSQAQIQQVLSEQQQEIQRRVQTLRRGSPLPDMRGRTIILVDDGIATGATLFATIALCKKNGAGKIIVAAPISGMSMVHLLRRQVDDVVILETPEMYGAVSQGYLKFNNLTDEETLDFLERWEKEHRSGIVP